MSVNLKIEDTYENPYLASYNGCINLGVEKIGSSDKCVPVAGKSIKSVDSDRS